MLATLAQYKTRYGITTSNDDAIITQVLEEVSDDLAAEAARICNGESCLEKTSLVEYITVPELRTKSVFLTAHPIVSITEIKEAIFGGYDDVDALTENDDFQIDGPTGILTRFGFWLTGIKTIKVTYIGGYTQAGDDPGTGETALPNAIRKAALMQAGFEFQRRNQLGLNSIGGQGGSVSTYAKDDLLPRVKKIMARYRRLL